MFLAQLAAVTDEDFATTASGTLAAMRLDRENADRYQELARAGLETTRPAMQRARPLAERDASMCHGISGLIDIVLTGGPSSTDSATLA